LCEDLDEGKYSLPLIHALKQTKTGRQVKELLSQRHLQGRLTGSQKQLLLRLIQEAGSLDFTLKILQSIGHDLQAEIERLEAQFGKANYELRLILEMLKV
jgi:geranylgeranyl pyrophosphate synthase